MRIFEDVLHLARFKLWGDYDSCIEHKAGLIQNKRKKKEIV